MLITTMFVAIQYVSCRQGIVQEFFLNKKILCLSLSKIVYTVASEIQCVHRCLKHNNCGVLNFKESHFPSKLKDNCEVYSLLSTNSTCSTLADQTDWKAMTFKVILVLIEFEIRIRNRKFAECPCFQNKTKNAFL